MTILFATSVAEELVRFLDLVALKRLNYTVRVPVSISEADQIIAKESVDLIVTDLGFANGAFADWLMLWPRPFILLGYYGEEERLDGLIRDEACSFVMRDSSHRHLGALPTMIRKVLNIRESRDRQNAHFQISERRYLDLVSTLPDIVYILDGKGHFTYLNDSVSLLGYKPAELVGKHFSVIIQEDEMKKVSRELVLPSLRGQETGSAGAPKLFDERRSGPRMTRDLVVQLRLKPPSSQVPAIGNVHAFGETYGEISCVGYMLPEYEGSDIGTVGIIRDVTTRRREELKLKESLRVKDVLLKEIHHRVKNNLQVVSSLISLQGSVIEDEESRSIFQDCQTQIQSMAMVHEQLYRSDDLQAIDMGAFLGSLVEYLFRVFNVNEKLVRSTVSCCSITLGIDQAIPVALIVNELVSNSIKHGLGRTGGSISVVFDAVADDRVRLEVRDNGEGIPEDFNAQSTETLGFQLIGALSSQLGGQMSWENAQGARFSLVFPYAQPPSLELF